VAFIAITPRVGVDDNEIVYSFARSSGPGGQNVNKVETAVQLRFDALGSPSLDPGTKARLKSLAGSRMTKDGVLVLVGQNFRTQDRNRQDVTERLFALIAAAAERPRPRIKTKPTLGSQKRRVEAKLRRGATKKMRQTDFRGD
jgi:ribosome-associated protein